MPRPPHPYAGPALAIISSLDHLGLLVSLSDHGWTVGNLVDHIADIIERAAEESGQ